MPGATGREVETRSMPSPADAGAATRSCAEPTADKAVTASEAAARTAAARTPSLR
ncbi:hypothetical protein U9R90_04715 [Streptomyces sp. E11-3]|uniref:hypothetical protein n=1 Tax=Streptomyces sp. E11-3 TaxID=3110112 RepID=UPI00397F8402